MKLLLKQEGTIADKNGKKAEDYVTSVNCRDIWALFSGEVEDEYVIQLEKAHGSECVCPQEADDLHCAAMSGCLKCVARNLFQTGAFYDDKTALMIAATEDHQDIVELLLAKEATLRAMDGKTALMHAAEAGSPGAVQILLSHEAGSKDVDGKTALVYAVQSGCIEAVRLLLPHEEKIVDKRGLRPVDHAMAAYNPKIWKLFPKEIGLEFATQLTKAHKSRCSCAEKCRNLMQAAVLGCPRCAARYITHTGKRAGQWTALMLAAAKGHSELVELLMHREAKLVDNCCRTALMLTAMRGHADVARVLAPMEATMRDMDGATAIHHAAFWGRGEVVEALAPLEAKMQTNAGETALMQAASQGHLSVI